MPSPMNWDLPYPSQRMPVFGANIVATSQPLAAQAGLRILQQGGNAADAAIATAACMAVLEPCSNGLGADAFSLIWDGKALHGLNASGRAPQAMTVDRLRGQTQMPRFGWDTVTVPGAVSAWVAVSKKFGRLPFAQLLEPAIRYAQNGFPVAPQTSEAWCATPKLYKDFPQFLAMFCPMGSGPAPGDRVVLADQAATLRKIADSTGEAYYRGELAKKIAAHARATGGLLTEDDLASHTADWVEPLSIDYRGYRVWEIPPNGQGLAALLALGILRHREIGSLSVDCPDVLHLQIEAMKLAFADAHRYIADPKWMDMDVAKLLASPYLSDRAQLLDPSHARDPNWGTPRPGGTILLTTADASGMMVSFIQSNYEGFGSGIVIPGTGIHLQNRGSCFNLEPGHVNQIAGGKRPYHTILPAFVTVPNEKGDQEPLMSFGVMGGYMQPQGHVQVLSRILDFHQNPQAALDAPRWQVTREKKLGLETGFPPAVYEELQRRGHEITRAEKFTVLFGGGQIIYRLPNGLYCGASDMRRDGQAVGF